MNQITLSHETDVDLWRAAVRPLLARRLPPESLSWRVGQEAPDLFSDMAEPPRGKTRLAVTHPIRITKQQMALCERVLCHTDPARFHHLYSVLQRLQMDPHALDDPGFHSGKWVRAADQSIRRDRHKMHAFVRFKKVGDRPSSEGAREVFAAWFEPDYRIVELTAAFFARRFTGMDWSILTPYACSHWNAEILSFSPGVDKTHAPDADVLESAWTTYYSSIFNPSRVKISAMMSEMPKKYWKNLPEASVIPHLIQEAEHQKSGFMSAPETAPHKLARKITPDVYALRATPKDITSWDEAKQAAERCTSCALHQCATQTVFGEGPLNADLMLVGEQPGDREDLTGRVFTGPAGELLDKALIAAGLDRRNLYITNAVKHFKFAPRGKIRLHRTPTVDEIKSCKYWLDLERKFIRPRVILALGKTALRSLTGYSAALNSVRGQKISGLNGDIILATYHPSYLLRLPHGQARAEACRKFTADLSQGQSLADAPQMMK